MCCAKRGEQYWNVGEMSTACGISDAFVAVSDAVWTELRVAELRWLR